MADSWEELKQLLQGERRSTGDAMGLEDSQTALQYDLQSFKENLKVHGIADQSLEFQLPDPTSIEVCGTREREELLVLPPFIELRLDPAYIPPSPSPPLCDSTRAEPHSDDAMVQETTHDVAGPHCDDVMVQENTHDDCLTRAPLHPSTMDTTPVAAMDIAAVSMATEPVTKGPRKERPVKRKRKNSNDDDVIDLTQP